MTRFDPRHRKGREAEDQALIYLQQHGLKLLDRNFNCRFGEIDLVMQDRSAIQTHILVCVEVRYRQSSRFGGAAASVSPAKQQRLRTTIRRYVQLHRSTRSWPIRFDVVALQGVHDNLQITWLPRAFE